MIHRRDVIMEMIERFMAVMFRLAGLKAIGAYDDVLALINDYLNDLFAQSGRVYEPEQLADYLAHTDLDEGLRLRVLALLKEKSVVLQAMGAHTQAASTLETLLASIRESTTGHIDREGRQKLLGEVCSSALPAVVAPTLFSSLLSTLVMYGLYAKADDVVFRYESILAEPSAHAAAIQMYKTIRQFDETELRSGNFSHEEVEESMAELRRLAGTAGA